MAIWNNTILPAIISVVVGVITAYVTARITVRQEVRKKLAETLATQRIGPLLTDLSLWVERMRTGTPTPRDWQEGENATAFAQTINEFDTWITINLGNLRVLDPHLAECACAFRDQARESDSTERGRYE